MKSASRSARMHGFARCNVALQSGLHASTSHVKKTIERALLADKFGRQLSCFLPEIVRMERAEWDTALSTPFAAKVSMPAK